MNPSGRHRRCGRTVLEIGQCRDPARRVRQSRSSHAIDECLAQGLPEAGLPEDAIELVPTRDRAAVGAMLEG